MNDFRRFNSCRGIGIILLLCGNYRRILFDCDSSAEKERKRASGIGKMQLQLVTVFLQPAVFYGVVIDMTDEVVIVESLEVTKNCRIPMQKSAIVEVDKKQKKPNWNKKEPCI